MYQPAPAHYKLTDFQAFLAKTGLIESSQRQVIMAMRRALKHLGPDRLTDENELLLYRMSMPEATRRLFGYAWSKFQPYMESLGEPVPELPKLNKTQIVHPLWADLTDLSIHLNVNLIPQMRWRDILDSTDMVHEPARRAFEFIVGREPMEIDWALPRDATASSPMPVWMIETILRTNPTDRDSEVEKAAFGLLQAATRRGIGPIDLKGLWKAVGENLETQAGRRRIVRLDSLEIDSDGPWTDDDQETVLSVLGGTKIREVPEERRIDISGAVVALQQAINRTGSGAALDE
jgi:hypothetical protein